MNKTKVAFMTTLLGSVFALTACQSTPQNKHADEKQHHGKHQMKKDGEHRNHKQRQQLTPEQRAEWQAKREQRQQQQEKIRQDRQQQRALIEKACEGKKVGQTVNVQWQQRTIQGKCEVRFTPDKSQFKRQTNPTT
ncbi:heavy-metal resistance [Acinetobacter sp. NIPH 2699]|uniref:heavy-metal resistance n=1 Tax=Acinetobacter sp. NIPH 2699 TaxID=2923433 RepID=UPI001F4AFDC4|nr:heavy-metal resistance [Acinetobacter sp. NIPH 2699]MCH7336511.1 heavy-metal resistance [Acinetobacter sp. NIPH 2699]